MTLEEQFKALAAEHRVGHISVALYTLDTGRQFYGANAHDGPHVGSGTSNTSVSEALAKAFADCAISRAKAVELPVLEAA